MAGSLKYEQATASLIVGKWSASSRQNTLAAALKEWGTLRRTIHAAKYLSDPAYRRKIARQLNKGESLHALRRDLHYAQQGAIGKPLLADQTEQAWCLTVLTNSVITWTTEYYQIAVRDLRARGRAVPDEILAHISPARSENVNFFGVITVDVEAELAKLGPAGWRPLRPAAPDPGRFSDPERDQWIVAGPAAPRRPVKVAHAACGRCASVPKARCHETVNKAAREGARLP